MNFGKKHWEQLSGFAVSIAGFTTASFISMVYLTDWKVICEYIPFYNKKFTETSEE